jgi:putative membrane-bound dehydrogenase-like protein
MPWRHGLIVTCAPDLLWLADTNGDGRADVREVWLTGFDDKNTTQLRVSHPILGPDGWIYLTSGWTGESTVRSPKFPDHPPVKVRTDSRFNPFTGVFEAIDGRGQFGQTFDDWGHRFICYNRVHAQHVVLSSRYLRRNPALAFAETVQNCPETLEPEPLKGHGAAGRIYPVSENITTADSHAGTFTAACGVHVYRGEALPAYRNRIFACDPTGNLVHWDELLPNGPTFLARRSTHHAEFLASTDNWFRPVNLATGPDGALYVCSMYRKTIEHPQYLPEEVRKRTDFDSGKGLGRIYRVIAADAPSLSSPTRKEKRDLLASRTTTELVAALSSRNGWHSDTAFRLLMEHRDQSIAPLLRQQVTNPTPQMSEARARALRLLEILGALDEPILLSAFHSTNQSPGLLETALQLAEPHWMDWPALQVEAIKLLDGRGGDRVQFQAFLVTGPLPYERKRDKLLQALRQSPFPDRWLRAALLSSLAGQSGPFLRDLIQEYEHPNGYAMAPPALELLFELGRLSAAELGESDLPLLAKSLAQWARERAEGPARVASTAASSAELGRRPRAEWELPPLHGIAEWLQSSKPRAVAFKDLLQTPSELPRPITDTRLSGLDAVLIRSRHALSNESSLTVRAAAVALLAEGANAADREILLGLVAPGTPPELQQVAVRHFVRMAGSNAAAALLAPARWRACTPALQETILGAVFARSESLPGLLQALETGVLPLGTISSTRREQLLKHKEEAIRRRAQALFQHVTESDRMKAFREAQACLTLQPLPANGREIFKRSCASCHRLDREGTAVGPDLFGIRNQPKETILLHLIVPEYEIAPAFANYLLETRDGRTLSGLIAAETPVSVTLRQAQGIEETILRRDLVSLTASPLSLMPQELEKGLSLQDLADLLAYLKGQGE